MKQYDVDELRPADYSRLKTYLDEHYAVAAFEGLYQVLLPEGLLEEVQREHAECQPFYFALELAPAKLSCELLVRSRQRIRCSCIQYASERQRNWLIDCVDAILAQLGISV